MTPEPTRRRFLRDLAAGAALLPTTLAAGAAPASALPASHATRAPAATGGRRTADPFWDGIRDRFAFGEDRVPMNAANLCPSPRSVAERVSALTLDIDLDCSFQNRAKFDDLLEASRRGVAEHLKLSPDEIALVRNTSEANNTINAGLPLQAGDEVVVWDQNHPTNNVAWDVRAARSGIVVRRVSTPERPTGPGDLVAPFVDALGPRTRVLALTHISNLSGIRLPVAEIAAAARTRGVHVHVDGAQSLGAVELDLRALGCDSFSSSSHKWLMGPKEAGVLYVRADKVASIWPAGVAPGWGSDADPDVVGARKFESLGQRDDACLAAMADTMALHREIGPARIEARVAELAGALKAGAADLGIPLVTPVDPALSAGVVILRVAGNRRAVYDRLYHDFGIAGASTGGLRLSPHVYNTMAHVERAVAAMEAMRGEIMGA